VGVACFPEDGRSLDALAARADRALYQAKKSGRNCVVRYQPA
jgi:diguanylate cyclase (GGDEF)-like protein